MIFAVIGSRSFTNYELLKNTLHKYDITKIVSGGAKGADLLAKQYALENDIPIEEFLPDWEKHGRSAGIRRNEKIINNCESVIAFWDGESTGTLHSLNLASARNLPVEVIQFSSQNPSLGELNDA